MIRHPPRSPLFPYTPLFRSELAGVTGAQPQRHDDPATDSIVLLGGVRPGVAAELVVQRREPLVAGDRDLTGEALEQVRSEEHTSELQSQSNLVCRLLLEKKK